MDWSYSDCSMNYCVLDEYFDERDIVSDIHNATCIPNDVIWVAFRDFKENNPYYVKLAQQYAENGCEPIEDEDEDY